MKEILCTLNGQTGILSRALKPVPVRFVREMDWKDALEAVQGRAPTIAVGRGAFLALERSVGLVTLISLS